MQLSISNISEENLNIIFNSSCFNVVYKTAHSTQELLKKKFFVCIKAPLYPKSVLCSAVEVDNRRLMEGYKCNLGTSQHWKDTNGTHHFTNFREIKKIFQAKKKCFGFYNIKCRSDNPSC